MANPFIGPEVYPADAQVPSTYGPGTYGNLTSCSSLPRMDVISDYGPVNVNSAHYPQS